MNDLFKFEDVTTVCRVCLNKTKILVLLSNYLHGDSAGGGPLISNVLSYIMSTEVEDNHPRGICPGCLNRVKQAYNLKLQFEKSQKLLQKYENCIIASYIKNELFEVYEVNDNFGNSNNLIKTEFTTGSENILDDSKLKDNKISPCIFKDEKRERDESCPQITNPEHAIAKEICTDKDEIVMNIIEEHDGKIALNMKVNDNFGNSNNLIKTEFTTGSENILDDSKLKDNKISPCIFKDEKRERDESCPQITNPEHAKEIYTDKDEIVMNIIEEHDGKIALNMKIGENGINKYIIETKNASTVKVSNDQCDLEKPYTADKVRCPICGNYYSKGRFTWHLIHCKKLKITTLTCKHCHKVFKKVRDLNYHTKIEHSLNPPLFPCKICGFLCRTNSARQAHIRKEHGGKKSFMCDICGKGFFYNAGLLKHKGKHTKEVQEVCNICGKSFHYKGALFYHVKMHTNERKYLCNFCEKAFYTSQSLQRHIDTHTGDRRFKCKFCDKSFRSSSDRRRHEMIHTGERRYLCSYCNKGFISKYNHDIHVSSHRGQVPCNVCNRNFLNTEVLRLHLKLKHKGLLEETTLKESGK